MLQLIPQVHISSVERCSGHGGSFGVMKETHSTALKIGKPVFNRVIRNSEDNEGERNE